MGNKVVSEPPEPKPSISLENAHFLVIQTSLLDMDETTRIYLKHLSSLAHKSQAHAQLFIESVTAYKKFVDNTTPEDRKNDEKSPKEWMNQAKSYFLILMSRCENEDSKEFKFYEEMHNTIEEPEIYLARLEEWNKNWKKAILME